LTRRADARSASADLRALSVLSGPEHLCKLHDYVTKYCLASTVTTTCRGADALRCVDLAVHEAQRLLNLTDLRGDRGVMDIIDAPG
jgi:putative transposase